MSLVDELSRRNVFRVAIAYVVAAWLIAQVAALALESFGAPGWVIKAVLFLLALGFPLALVLAWAFELTPQGIRREESGSDEQSVPRSRNPVDRLIVVLLVIALAYFSYDNFMPTTDPDIELDESAAPVADVADREPSIAVLPFVNMSDDPGNEYFSEGLSEELLNTLARIPDLQVAARTSSFSFKGRTVQIAEIADELNVDHILEGSVRKAGDRVRISVQLINAEDGYRMLSETYERTLDDIFAVQDEIAVSVVDALKITLLSAKVAEQQTDPVVYSLYLKGRYFNNLKGKENWENATAALTEAIAIDPQYAPAWSELSTTYRYQTNNRLLELDEGIRLAREAAEHALSLDESLASAWVSLSHIRSLGYWDWAGAVEAADRARALEPNNADVLNAIGGIASIVGRFDTAITALESAVEQDPLNQSSLNSLGLTYMNVGRFDDADAAFAQLLALNPQYPWGHINRGTVMLLRGDAEAALAEIRRNPPNPLRDVMEILARISLLDGEEEQRLVDEYASGTGATAPYWMAYVHAWRGDADAAFESLDRAVDSREPGVTFILGAPFFDDLRSDPRWPALLDRMGLRTPAEPITN